MKAAVLYGKNDIRYEEINTPRITEGNQVKVRVKACGICKSDVPRVVEGTAKKFPLILGHEFSGIVTEVGEKVEDLSPGDHVAGVPLIPCFKCDDCKEGNYSLCKNYSFIGSRQNGAYAEYIVLPAANVIKVDKSVDFKQAALIETSSVALHPFLICERERKKADNVAIVGTGTIGSFAVQWARILKNKMKTNNIVVFGRNEERLLLLKELGATHYINTNKEDYLKDAIDITDGKGFDYIIETAGVPETIKMCFHIAGNKADICMIGTPTKDFSFGWKEWELMNRKEFSVTGSWMSYSAPWPGTEWVKTVSCMKTGELIFDKRLLHKTISLKDVETVFKGFEKEKINGRIMINI